MIASGFRVHLREGGELAGVELVLDTPSTGYIARPGDKLLVPLEPVGDLVYSVAYGERATIRLEVVADVDFIEDDLEAAGDPNRAGVLFAAIENALGGARRRNGSVDLDGVAVFLDDAEQALAELKELRP